MADNTTLPGTGEVYASEEVGGVNFQRTKPVSNGLLEIARGSLSDHAVVNKFGGTPSVASNTQEDIWDGGGTYPFPGTADITHLRQAVDQAAMQGEDVEIQGLDASWDLTVQTVTLDGSDTTTPVSLGTPLIRVFRMKVQADVVTDQDIELRNVGGGTDYAVIQAGNNQTLMAVYTVPNGKTAFLTNYFGEAVRTAAQNPDNVKFKLWAADRANAYEFQLKHARVVNGEAASVEHSFQPYVKFTQKTDIKLTAHPSDKAAEVFGGFDLILVDN